MRSGRWYRVRVQILDDGRCGVAIDGRPVWLSAGALATRRGLRAALSGNSDRTRILMCQIFISSMEHFDGMNAVWDEWVAQGHTPPRATVEARLANPACLVEVCITASVI